MTTSGKRRRLSSVQMVDVGDKSPSERCATAGAAVRLSETALAALISGELPKGNVIAAAQLAGIQAAKRTPELLPLCHPLSEISLIEISIDPQEQAGRVEIRARVRAFGRTGVEMEALCGAAAAALCVYDMCKALDPALEIGEIRLLEKSGGKSGLWRHPEAKQSG